jgi:protein-tyrosine phosphatase
MSDGSGTRSRFSILCVCTGNVCRSPAAERLLRRALDPTVQIRSAGTHALVGEPIDPPVAALLTYADADSDAFVARQLTAADALAADLVLALTREHRTAVVELAPSTIRRTFTLREFARILATVDPGEVFGTDLSDRLRALVPVAAARRRRSTPVEDDVLDPYRGSAELHERTFDQIRSAVDMIAGVAIGRTRSAQPLP